MKSQDSVEREERESRRRVNPLRVWWQVRLWLAEWKWYIYSSPMRTCLFFKNLCFFSFISKRCIKKTLSTDLTTYYITWHKCSLCLLAYVTQARVSPSVCLILWLEYSMWAWCCFIDSWSQCLFDQMLHMYFASWWETDAISGLFGGPEQDLPWCWALFVSSLKTCLINVKHLTNITTLRQKYHLIRD